MGGIIVTIISLVADFSSVLTIPSPVNAFSASGFDFASIDPMQTGKKSGVQGLDFPNSGVRIRLPVTRDIVSLALQGAATEIRVQGLSAENGPLVTAVVNPDHAIHHLSLKAAGIASVLIDQGNNEGSLISISIDVEIAS